MNASPTARRPRPHCGIYQTSTMAALLDGVYDGDVTFAEIAKHGDFGLGTFNQLDGEMVAVEGHFYHLRADGTALTYDPSSRTLRAGDHHAPTITIGTDATSTRSRQDKERRTA